MITDRPTLVLTWLVATVVLITMACGEAVVGSDDDANDPDVSNIEMTMCQEAATAACEAACACQPTPNCYTAYGTVATAKYDDLNHCLAFEAFVCGSANVQDTAIQACIDQLGAPHR